MQLVDRVHVLGGSSLVNGTCRLSVGTVKKLIIHIESKKLFLKKTQLSIGMILILGRRQTPLPNTRRNTRSRTPASPISYIQRSPPPQTNTGVVQKIQMHCGKLEQIFEKYFKGFCVLQIFTIFS